MKTFPVISAIEYGATAKTVKRYEAGETIDLEDDVAEPLQAVGAIGEPIEAEIAAGKKK